MAGTTENATASLPISPHHARGNQPCSAQVGDYVHRQEHHCGADLRGGQVRQQHEQKHSRGTKRVKEYQQQPLPHVSTVSESSNHGRQSCEDRMNHSQNQHQTPEAGHACRITPCGGAFPSSEPVVPLFAPLESCISRGIIDHPFGRVFTLPGGKHEALSDPPGGGLACDLGHPAGATNRRFGGGRSGLFGCG